MATVQLQTCFSCLQQAARFHACMHCGARLTGGTPTPAAARVRRHVVERLEALLRSAHTEGTERKHQQIWGSFASYCRAPLDVIPLQAEPLDVVAFLQSRDSGGRKIVHTLACPSYRDPARARTVSCQCPKRLMHSSAKTYVMSLRAVFNSYGLNREWGLGAAGANPCFSLLVEKYLDSVYKEQLGAGIVATPAPIFSHAVYDAMVRACFREAAAVRSRRGSDGLLAEYKLVHDAFILALLYFCPNRSADVVMLRTADLALITVAGGYAVDFRLGLHKTSGTTRSGRYVAILEDGHASSLPTVYRMALAMDEQLVATGHLPLRDGHLLRPPALLEPLPVSGKAHKVPEPGYPPVKYSYIHGLLQRRLTGLVLTGVPGSITVHSFRASGAEYALCTLKHDPEHVMADFAWEAGGPSLNHYTGLLRQRITTLNRT